MTTTTIDLNKDLKNKKITLKKGSTDSIVFKNDIAGQIKITESGNDIVFKVYEAVGTKNTYTKVVDSYVAKDGKYQKTTTKYVYDGSAWKKSGKESVSIVNNMPSALEKKGKSCWCTYSMSSTGGSVSTLQSYYATDSADEKDDDYKTRIIAKFGSGDKSLTNKVIATIKIVDGNKASSFGYTSVKNGSDENILDNVFAPVRKGNKYTGNFLNEEVTLTSANETVNLKTGDDTVNMDFDNGLTSVGNDKITLNKNENLYLNLLNNVSEDGNISIKTSFSKKGNDLVVKYTKVDASSSDPIAESMGKTTIKNYFKIAKDNVFLYDESEDMTYSMKDALTYADGLGFLGDINSDKKQKIKGCFLDQVITTGSGNDEINAVDGNNTIYAGKGDDKIYSGKDADNIYIYEDDASGEKGDRIYNALEVDRLYIGDDEGNIDSADYMSNNYTFEKKGNSVAITRGADTVTLVDYFKKDKNRDMLFVNDTDDFSNITFEQKGRGTLYGTKYNDNIVTTGKATINTGAGNDKLTLKMKTNDTINITGAGEKEISVDTAHTGSIKFNKTINYKNTDATLKLSFENLSDDGEKRIYIRKGNNLVIGVGDYEIKNGELEYENNPDLRYTVKDYFKKDLESKISIIETEGGEPKTVSLSDDLASSAIIYQCGLFSKGDYTDTKYNDIFLGGLRDDKYNISKGGKDVIFDSRGNEKYTVDISKSSLTLYDTSGGKDSLTVKNANNYGLYFKVEASTNRVSNLGSTLQIFDQDDITDNIGSIKNGVSIEKYMSYDSDKGVKKGKGCIETIKVGSTNLNIDIESIANSVASWLSNKGYTSSDYVLANTDANTIKEMIAVFNGQ